MTTLPWFSRSWTCFGSDVLNFGLRMDAVGDDARLRAGQRDGGDAQRVQGDRGQRDGRLLAGGKEHIHFPLVGQRHDFLGQFDEIICHPAHGRDDDDNLVAFGVIFGDASGDILDALGIADRSAAVFLDEEHGCVSVVMQSVVSSLTNPCPLVARFSRRRFCRSGELPRRADRASDCHLDCGSDLL